MSEIHQLISNEHLAGIKLSFGASNCAHEGWPEFENSECQVQERRVVGFPGRHRSYMLKT
jgi:hypothetical protein